MIIDHVGFLKQLKILKGGKRAGSGTIQLGLKFFCFSNAVAAIAQAKKYFKSKASEAKGESDMKKRGADEWKCLQTIFKHLLLVLQTAHLSLLYQSGDTLVGLAGMITSLMDIDGQWPVKGVAGPKAIADAKASPDAKSKPK